MAGRTATGDGGDPVTRRGAVPAPGGPTLDWVRTSAGRRHRVVLLPGFLTRARVLFRRHLDVFAQFGSVGLVEYAPRGDPYAGGLVDLVCAAAREADGDGGVTLVGASFGAQVAITTLRRLGADRAAVGTFVSVGGPSDADDVRPPLAVLGRLAHLAPALAPVKNALLDGMMPGLPRAAMSPETREIDLRLRRADTLATTASALTARLAAMRVQVPLARAEFDGVRAVTVHAGDDADPYVHARAEAKLAGAFPGSRRGRRVPAGHINFLEHRDAYTRAVTDALTWAAPCRGAVREEQR
jgi:pimeloyl-ACP methyl ester carboxylesterase